LVLITASIIVLVAAMGLTTLGPSEEKKAAGSGPKEPTGKPVATLDVQALASTKFDSDAYTLTAAGVVQVNYGGAAGHTLAFSDPKLSGFLLHSSGSPKSGKVELKPGTYTIFCTVPGHRAQGMQATVTVP